MPIRLGPSDVLVDVGDGLGQAGPYLEEDGLALLRGFLQVWSSNDGLVMVENLTERL